MTELINLLQSLVVVKFEPSFICNCNRLTSESTKCLNVQTILKHIIVYEIH